MGRLIFVIVLFITSCISFLKSEDEELSYKKEDVPEGKLKLNGYFYLSKINEVERLEESKHLLFLYSNGVVFETKSVKIGHSFENESKVLLDTAFINSIKKIKSHWGIYKIDGNKIFMEEWVTNPDKYVVYLNEGEVINDTTFIIKKIIKKSSNKEIFRNLTYRYRKFSQKPDSTNIFIK